MDNSEYLEMFRRAREKLPKKEQTSRFEIPNALINQAGKQTIIKNFNEIVKSLRREPQHIGKYLFKELAVSGNVDKELLLQGKFSAYVIDKKIENYVKEFVLCEECGKPDTMLYKEDKQWVLKCEACGAKKPVRRL